MDNKSSAVVIVVITISVVDGCNFGCGGSDRDKRQPNVVSLLLLL